ncbi:MAG: hypothetical protein KDA27_07765 [Candidatus Eisenbacteria bacterium]|uniref:TIGR03016 family PEP-CTERM system-associated outer membrane protein n=1 Tax=Eiseniibacteriota bacterium TaxID=2212470 RepID=A0A956NB05_UNCEI|nr:hypothetical protein [Candidatus Eisenbacteria bacterium]
MRRNSTCAVFLCGFALASSGLAWAGEEPEGSQLEGTVRLGSHVSAVHDLLGRVREYDQGREELQPDLMLELFGYSGWSRMAFEVDYDDEDVLQLGADVEVGKYVDAEFDHRSLIHHLDHDRLGNLTWREFVGVGDQGQDLPGGKMVTHDDTDPYGKYSVRYSDTRQSVEVAIPHLPGTTLKGTYRDQIRSGTRQTTGVDHCSNCHVRSHGAIVEEQTRDVGFLLATVRDRVAVSYEFGARDFANKAEATRNRFQQARHPVNGGSAEEFASRLNYDDATLVVSDAPDVEKRSHTVRASVDLPKSQSARGAFSYSKTTNLDANLELTANAAALGWAAPLNEKVRVTASFSRRQLENDPVDIDLKNWREGRAGGGQDFDYTRESVYDRVEMTGTAKLRYALRPGHSLGLEYRFRSIDRDNLELDPDDPTKTQTVHNRIRGTWNGRLSAGMRSRASVEYEMTSLPFVNVDGICEEGIGETIDPMEGQPNDWIYYFQRERYGTGANAPTKSFRLRANLSRTLGPKASGSVYVNAASEKNDDLNLFDFERTTYTAGFSAYAMPNEKMVFAGGGSIGKTSSSAVFCATVMDG